MKENKGSSLFDGTISMLRMTHKHLRSMAWRRKGGGRKARHGYVLTPPRAIRYVCVRAALTFCAHGSFT